MNMQEIVLSRKYAEAFINLFIDKLTVTDYHNTIRAAQFLKEDNQLVACFKLPQIDEVKKKVIDAFFEEFQLPFILKKLTDLLLHDQRLFLLPQVFENLIEFYRQRKGIMAFKVKSSDELTPNQLEVIIIALAAKTRKQIEYDYKIDKALIAGLRLQSNSLLWERSVAQQLNEARCILIS
jgi:F-type H+-transporting ATPase subunit delta